MAFFDDHRSFFQRRRFRATINLGSNELLHPLLDNIYLNKFDKSRSDSHLYPIQFPAVDKAEYFLSRSSNEFLFSPGTDTAIRTFVMAAPLLGLTRIILPDPSYTAWREALDYSTLELEQVPMIGNSKVDLDNISSRLNGIPTLVAITWPNAPISSGSFQLNQLFELDELCRANNSLLVIDLCYAPFNYSIEDISTVTSKLTTIFSASKSFGLAGLRIGLVTGDPSLCYILSKLGLENSVSQPAFDYFVTAINNLASFQLIWSDICTQRDRSIAALRKHNFSVPSSEANFFHILLSETNSAQIVRHFSRLGVRIKANSALPWQSTVRIGVTCFSDMDDILSELINIKYLFI